MKLDAEFSFALGAAISWLATYLVLTHEKRMISRIKSNLDSLAGYHNLTQHQYTQIHPPLYGGSASIPLASDEQILNTYNWAVRIRKESGSLK
jgi:hypothetical protein